MAFNGSGTFVRLYNWVTDRGNSIKIRADRMDGEMDGIASGLSNVICKDGQTTLTADIPFNNRKITALGDATLGTHALNRQTGDVRYQLRPSTLTATATFDDTDVLGFYDSTTTTDLSLTGALFRSDLLTKWRTSGYVFSAGVRMLFQSTPPTGWTLEVGAAYNDAALKFTTGAVGTGGAQAFSTLFASQTFTGSISSSSLSTAQLAAHTHDLVMDETGNNGIDVGVPHWNYGANLISANVSKTSTSTGSGSTHGHALTMNAFSMDLKFATINIGQKS